MATSPSGFVRDYDAPFSSPFAARLGDRSDER